MFQTYSIDSWLDHEGLCLQSRFGQPGMNSKTVTVVALVKAKPGKEAALKKALLALIPPTRKEKGCLNYDLHQDIEDPSRFIFHENWTSKAHLDAHLNSPHLQAFDTNAGPFVAEPPQIIVAQKIG
jgi:quinol monooxygenase YgiN